MVFVFLFLTDFTDTIVSGFIHVAEMALFYFFMTENH